jgi:hypothetical protein
MVDQARNIDVLERKVLDQKVFGKSHGLSRRLKDAHLGSFGFDSILLQVNAALVGAPPSSIITQLAAVLLDYDYSRSCLKFDAGITPCYQPRQVGL